MKRLFCTLCLSSLLWNTTFAFSFDFGSVGSSFKNVGSSFSNSFSSFSGSLKNTFSQAQNSYKQIQSIGKNIQGQFDGVTKQFDTLKGQADGFLNQFKSLKGELDGYTQQLGKVEILGQEISKEQKENFDTLFKKSNEKLKETNALISVGQKDIAKFKQERKELEEKKEEILAKQQEAQAGNEDYLKESGEIDQAIAAIQQDMDEQWAQVKTSATTAGYGNLLPEEETNTGQKSTISPIAGIWRKLTASIMITEDSTSTTNEDIPTFSPDFNLPTSLENSSLGFDAPFDVSTDEPSPVQNPQPTSTGPSETPSTEIKTTLQPTNPFAPIDFSLPNTNTTPQNYVEITPEQNAAINKQYQEQINQYEDTIQTKQKEIENRNQAVVDTQKELDKVRKDPKIQEVRNLETSVEKLKKEYEAENDQNKKRVLEQELLEKQQSLSLSKEKNKDVLAKETAALQKATNAKEASTGIPELQKQIKDAKKARDEIKVSQAQREIASATTPQEKLEANQKLQQAQNQYKSNFEPGDPEYEKAKKAQEELKKQEGPLNEISLNAKKTATQQNIEKNKSEIDKKDKAIAEKKKAIANEKDPKKKAQLEEEKAQLEKDKAKLEKDNEKLKEDEKVLTQSYGAQKLENVINQKEEALTTQEKDLQTKIQKHKELKTELDTLKAKKDKVAKEKPDADCKNDNGQTVKCGELLKNIEKQIEEKNEAIKSTQKTIEEAEETIAKTKEQIKEAKEQLAQYQCEYQNANGDIKYRSEGYCVQLNTPIGKTVSIRGKNGLDLFAQYVGIIYRYAASIIGIIAVLVIVVSGVQISLAGFNSELSSSAKTRIMQALASLILLFLIGLILKTVNPTFFNRDGTEVGKDISTQSPTTGGTGGTSTTGGATTPTQGGGTTPTGQ